MSKQTTGGWTLTDLEALPEDCRVEVLDGAPLVRSSSLPVHQRITRRLAAALEPQLSQAWQLETEVSLLLADDPLDHLRPNIVVFRSDIPLTDRFVRGSEVLLAVEVAGFADRIATAYARAGIPHLWRVEDGAVHTYVLEDGRYVPSGAFRDRLVAMVGAPVEIDLGFLA